MESSRDMGSTRPAPAPRTTGYSAESTPTYVINAEDVDEHARISQNHQARRDEATSAYLLKWTDTKVTKTHIDSVAHLRSCIRDDSNSTRHLFVFHGLPIDYGVALKEVVDIDASFIEAHIGRRSYRPLRKIKAGWAHYDYPELVCQSSVLGDGRLDLVGDPPAYLTSGSGDSVMLCRVSIWLSEKAHVLFLDRAPWTNLESGDSKRRYIAYTTEKMPDKNGAPTITIQINPNGNANTLRDETPDLETMLYDNLQGNCTSREGILELLENLAINKWVGFFETLDTDLSVGLASTTALFSQTLCCLERNLDVSRRRYKMTRRPADARADTHTLLDTDLQPTTTEWEALLARLSRRAQLSSYISPAVANAKMPVQRPSAKTDVVAAGLGISSAAAGGHANDCNCKSRNNYNNTGTNSPRQADEGQRSLNRVAYLGGVLLPFSVVSGILAIEDPFGPGNPQFWIFWAVTVPLVLATLGVIYADSIRKAEVWIEVTTTTTTTAASGGKSDGESSPGRRRTSTTTPTPDVEQALPPVSGRIAMFSLVDDNDTAPVVENAADTGEEEPDRMVEKRWKSADRARIGHHHASGEAAHWAGKERWRKEELGWMGAFATMFQLYKLKTGVPPERLRRS
ncbi:hypothetical protein F4782DRAFT_519656 [Xylaria castorea]|nr:hypothetical protein F4782DRAFT_519656 [Xylaria castorea]